MIYELALDVAGMLEAAKLPVRVVYGPERAARERGETHVIFERERGVDDTIGPARGQQRNARKVLTRELPAVARVYARSSLAGAHVGNHEALCEKIVDALLVAIAQWGTASRAGPITFTGSKYLTAADRDDVESWSGVVFEIRFRVPRGVFALGYDGERSTGTAKPTGAPTAVTNTNRVRLTGAPEDQEPEIGCGA